MNTSTVIAIMGNTSDVAARYGLSEATLASLRTKGGGPAFLKVGTKVIYRFSDVEDWLAARMRTSTSEA